MFKSKKQKIDKFVEIKKKIQNHPIFKKVVHKPKIPKITLDSVDVVSKEISNTLQNLEKSAMLEDNVEKETGERAMNYQSLEDCQTTLSTRLKIIKLKKEMQSEKTAEVEVLKEMIEDANHSENEQISLESLSLRNKKNDKENKDSSDDSSDSSETHPMPKEQEKKARKPNYINDQGIEVCPAYSSDEEISVGDILKRRSQLRGEAEKSPMTNPMLAINPMLARNSLFMKHYERRNTQQKH